MSKMEDGVGSDGGLVKKKNSSGCLIIKQKKEEILSSVKVSELHDKKKKRPRLVLSDSESSEDSLEQIKKKVVETSGLSNGESESERKRRLDVFEFDEYDNIDEKRLKRERDFEQGSSKHVTVEKRQQFDKMGKKDLSGSSVKSKLKIEENDDVDYKRVKKERDLQPGSGKHVALEKRKQFDKINNSSGGKKKLVNSSVKSRLKIEGGDDGDLPISSLRQKLHSPPNEPIRSQGKNGVLKVMVSKKKKMEVHKSSNHRKLDFEDEKFSKSEEITKKKKSVSFFSESKVMGNKREVKVEKSTVMEAHSPSRGVKREKVQSPGKVTPVRESVCKIKRGFGTEKQKLREKLKKVLLDAGWKIDYRPRRSRDYLDAVYISPRGTAYWSIVKAYDAFQKQMDDDVEMEPSSFADDIKILTRKTQKKIEREMKMKRKANNRKGKFTEESDEDSDSDEDSESMKRNNSSTKKAKKTLTESNDRKGRKLGRCTLLVRSSGKGINSENEGYIAYTGKRTLLSWLIDSGIVSSSEKVKYMNRRQTRVLLKGWVARGGIHCSCCSKVVSVRKFEIHARSKVHQPYQNICLESGVSLLQCLFEAWNKQDGSDHSGFHTVDIDGDDSNDDTCSLCGDGGDLICCDSCPSTFHQSCLDIEILPSGDWHCPNCTCKFCGIGGTYTSADENDTAVNVMQTCGLCERKYHESCCEKVDDSSNSTCSSASFCGPKCHKIFDHLKKNLGVKHKLDDGFSWSLVHRSDVDTDASHRSYSQRVESNAKLAVALSVMDECFLPIVDRRSDINLVNSILYNCGSNFSRLNFSGFYTVILEKGDEIVAAASIRFRGTQLAEMPFIGTRHMYRRQGMCRRLLGAIESVLRSLKVKKLTIPAIAEHMHTWTAIFGFKPFEVSHKQELRSLNMVVFPGVDMLQKFLVKKKSSEADITAISGGESILPEENHHLTPDMVNKDDVNDCAGHDIDTGDGGATLHNGSEANDKSDVVEPTLVVPLNGNNTKEMINEGEYAVSPLFPTCSKELDVGPKTDLNQLGNVSPSSLSHTDQPDARLLTDTDQPGFKGLVTTERKIDEAVKVCDLVVGADPEGDPANNNIDGTVSEIASDKPVVSPVNIPALKDTVEAENNENRGDVPAQNGNNTKEMINEGEDPVSPLSPNCERIDVGLKTDLNQLDEVSPSSFSYTDLPDVRPSADTDQSDLNGLVKTECKLDEAVKVCDSVVVPDSQADIVANSDETVSEIVSDKLVDSPENVPHPNNTGEAENNTHLNDLPAQNGTNTKQMINEGEDLVSPLSPKCSEEIDVGPKTDLNQMDTLSQSSLSPNSQFDAQPSTDTNQLDLNELLKSESKLDEAVKVKFCDLVVGPNSEDDIANNSDETVSEIACDKPVPTPVNIPDPIKTGEAENNVNHGDILTQNGTLEDNASTFVDDDMDGDRKINGEVASVEPGLDCFNETQLHKGINEDDDPLSVLKLKEETISKLTLDSENGMAKDVLEVNASLGPDLNSSSTEGIVEEVKENITV